MFARVTGAAASVLSVRAARTRLLALVAGGALIAGSGLVSGISPSAQAATPPTDIVTLERSLTITPSTPAKSWTVPAAIAGAIDVTVVGAPGTGLQGGGAAAAFDFSATRPAGEQWSFVFGAQNAQSFASLAGGAGIGLPALRPGEADIWAWPWKAARQSGANGGDATAIIAGAGGARCDSDAEVLAVAGGGGGGSGESRVWSVGSVLANAAYRGGEPGRDARAWVRGTALSAGALCATVGTNSRGAEPQGEDLFRHAGGGGGGGGVTAGDGGGPDRIDHGFFRDDFTSAGGGQGGSNYLSPSICGNCADREARPSRSGQSITLRWQEKHTPVITADRPNNPLIVRVVSAETGQPLPGTITIGREDGTPILTTPNGVGRWSIDALAHISEINVIDRSDDDEYMGYENITIAYTPDIPTARGGQIVHLIESVEATTTVTTQVRRQADGTFLLVARWDALVGSSAVDLDGHSIEVRANPPRTFDDTVATLPLLRSASLPENARCVAIRMDAPDTTDIGLVFHETKTLWRSSSQTRVDATTPQGDIGIDCGAPVDLVVDAPPPPPETPVDEGEWPTGPDWHWTGTEEVAYDRPPSGYEPGKVVIQRTYWTGGGEENRYVVHYYYDNTYAGYATYDHSGWGLALPPLTPGEHTVQAVFTPIETTGGEAVVDGGVGPVHTFTVPADSTSVTLAASADDADAAGVRRAAATDDEELTAGEPLQLKAQVRGDGIERVDGGLVAFYDDELLIGHAPVVEGTATLGGVHLDGMSNRVRAAYLGVDGVTLPSESDRQTVAYGETGVELDVQGALDTLVADADGQIVFTARAVSGDRAPSGTLSLRSEQDHELLLFSDADAVPGVDGRSLSWALPLSVLSADAHVLQASFEGDPGFADTRSATWTTTVEKRPSTVSAVPSAPRGATIGLDVAASIDDEGKTARFAGDQPSGDVRVWAGDELIAQGFVLDGTGTVDVPADAAGRAGGQLRVEFLPASYDTAASETSVRIQAAAAGLATTGAEVPVPASLGIVGALLLLGAGLVWAGRRRARTTLG
ncbi:hypothetical protein AB0N73_05280 [Microbacterium sp. NPDC089189]|uniref:hypothetical protein n=1 Tax=Microbacterium sp. NPDC089189 TaxID=3154972 RepID=UPI0034312500